MDERFNTQSLEDLKHNNVRLVDVEVKLRWRLCFDYCETARRTVDEFTFQAERSERPPRFEFVETQRRDVCSVELLAHLLAPQNIQRGMSDYIVAQNLQNTARREMTLNLSRYSFLNKRSIERFTVDLAFGWYINLEQRSVDLPFPQAPSQL